MQENNFSVPSRAAEQKGNMLQKPRCDKEHVWLAGVQGFEAHLGLGLGSPNTQDTNLSNDNYRTRGTTNQWHSNPSQRRHQEPLLNRHKPEIIYYRIHNKDIDGQEAIQLESYRLKVKPMATLTHHQESRIQHRA